MHPQVPRSGRSSGPKTPERSNGQASSYGSRRNRNLHHQTQQTSNHNMSGQETNSQRYRGPSAPSVASVWVPPDPAIFAYQQTMFDSFTRELLDYVRYTQDVARRTQSSIRSVVLRLRTIACEIWPTARLGVFGSLSTGFFLPNSDIDLVLQGDISDPSSVRCLGASHIETLSALSLRVCSESWIGDVQLIDTAKVPVLKIKTRDGHRIDITSRGQLEDHSGEAARDMFREFSHRMPELLPLTLVLKQFLREQNLNHPYQGGLSSYSLTLLVIGFLQMMYNQCGKPPIIVEIDGWRERLKKKKQNADRNRSVAGYGSNTTKNEHNTKETRQNGSSSSMTTMSSSSNTLEIRTTTTSTTTTSTTTTGTTSSHTDINTTTTFDSTKNETIQPETSNIQTTTAESTKTETSKPETSNIQTTTAESTKSESTKTETSNIQITKQTSSSSVQGNSMNPDTDSSTNGTATARKVVTNDQNNDQHIDGLDIVTVDPIFDRHYGHVFTQSSYTSSAALIARGGCGLSLGLLLFRFLEFYGTCFDYEQYGLSVRNGGYFFGSAVQPIPQTQQSFPNQTMNNNNTMKRYQETQSIAQGGQNKKPNGNIDTFTGQTMPSKSNSGNNIPAYTAVNTYNTLTIEDPLFPGRNAAAASYSFGNIVASFEGAFFSLACFYPTPLTPTFLSCILDKSGFSDVELRLPSESDQEIHFSSTKRTEGSLSDEMHHTSSFGFGGQPHYYQSNKKKNNKHFHRLSSSTSEVGPTEPDDLVNSRPRSRSTCIQPTQPNYPSNPMDKHEDTSIHSTKPISTLDKTNHMQTSSTSHVNGMHTVKTPIKTRNGRSGSVDGHLKGHVEHR